MNASPVSPFSDGVPPKLKTAIIYSPNDLFAYLVEIIDGTKRYYISAHGDPLKFGNLEEARDAALKEKAQIAYLALSNAYEEMDATTCHSQREDYSYTEFFLRPEMEKELDPN